MWTDHKFVLLKTRLTPLLQFITCANGFTNKHQTDQMGNFAQSVSSLVQTDMFYHTLAQRILSHLLPMWLLPRSIAWCLRLKEAMSLWFSKAFSFLFFNFIPKGEKPSERARLANRTFVFHRLCCCWGGGGLNNDLCKETLLTDKSSCQAEICLIKGRLDPVICSAVLVSPCSICWGEGKITPFEQGDVSGRRRTGCPLCIFGLWMV